MSFDTNWLGLREPADHAARDQQLIAQIASVASARSPANLIDMGCGTGSTWRALQPHLPADTRWLLLDHDRALLDEAKSRIGAGNNVSFQQFDLNQTADLPLSQQTIVTASALFDLASEAFCSAFIQALSGHNCVLYAALNYDGHITWSESHPLDQAIVKAFNHHQQTEKEFGKALGPDATSCLAGLLERLSYQVIVRPSPWRLNASDAQLQVAFINGFRVPLLEMAEVPEKEVEQWLSFRLAAVRNPGSTCMVGHTDLLAYPQQSA